MSAELLLDAIGLIDDRFISCEIQRKWSFKKTVIVFVAAVLVAIMSFVTALAVSDEWKNRIYIRSVVHTQEFTHGTDVQVDHLQILEIPPLPDLDSDSETDLPMQEIGYQQIHEAIKAKYYKTNGYVSVFDGALYTCDRDEAHSNPRFWQITDDEIIPVNATRVKFNLWFGGKRHKILFDYAVIDGELFEIEWPPNMDRDPIGNGWMCTPVAGRTDVVWLRVAGKKEKSVTMYPLLLDLKTHKVTNLFADLPLDEIYVDSIHLSDTLDRAIVIGYKKYQNEQKQTRYIEGSWICDLKTNTISCVEEITGIRGRWGHWQYVDENTLNSITVDPDTELTTMYRYYIDSGECRLVLDHVNVKHLIANYAVIQNEDFSYSLWDLKNGEKRKLSGLYLAGMTVSESPSGNNILFASKWHNYEMEPWSVCYPKIGMLNTQTAKFQILKRDVRGKLSEYFYGWLDDATIVTLADDGTGGLFIYIYEYSAMKS